MQAPKPTNLGSGPDHHVAYPICTARCADRAPIGLEAQMKTLSKDLPFLSSQSDAASQARVAEIEAEIADLQAQAVLLLTG